MASAGHRSGAAQRQALWPGGSSPAAAAPAAGGRQQQPAATVRSQQRPGVAAGSWTVGTAAVAGAAAAATHGPGRPDRAVAVAAAANPARDPERSRRSALAGEPAQLPGAAQGNGLARDRRTAAAALPRSEPDPGCHAPALGALARSGQRPGPLERWLPAADPGPGGAQRQLLDPRQRATGADAAAVEPVADPPRRPAWQRAPAELDSAGAAAGHPAGQRQRAPACAGADARTAPRPPAGPLASLAALVDRHPATAGAAQPAPAGQRHAATASGASGRVAEWGAAAPGAAAGLPAAAVATAAGGPAGWHPRGAGTHRRSAQWSGA